MIREVGRGHAVEACRLNRARLKLEERKIKIFLKGMRRDTLRPGNRGGRIDGVEEKGERRNGTMTETGDEAKTETGDRAKTETGDGVKK